MEAASVLTLKAPLAVFLSPNDGNIKATRLGLLYRFRRIPSGDDGKKSSAAIKVNRIRRNATHAVHAVQHLEPNIQRDAVWELYKTERDYVADMALVLEVRPRSHINLRQMIMRPSKKYLNQTQLQALFGPLETLVAFHSHIVRALAELVENTNGDDTVHTVVGEMSRRMLRLSTDRAAMDKTLSEIGALFASIVLHCLIDGTHYLGGFLQSL